MGLRRGVLTLLAMSVSVGCATAHPPTMVSRFVREGKPAVDLGGPPLATRSTKSAAAIPKSPRVSNVPRMSSIEASVESFDRGLKDALLRLLAAPTAEHHLQVAAAYQRLGIMDQAYDYLTRSLQNNGPTSEVYDARARLARDWGHPDLGAADAHRAVYMTPNAARYHNTLGTILFRLGKVAHASDAFKEALRIEPEAWYALANLCRVNLAQGHTREAIAQCQQAKAMQENSKDKVQGAQ